MKKTNENLVILITLFAISIVIANVTGARTITTGLHIGPIELALSGGAITYAVTFLCTDIIGEIWGKATAQRVVKYGFIGQIFATACIMLTGVFPATDAVMDNAYQTLLGQNWIFVIGSLSAYLVSSRGTWPYSMQSATATLPSMAAPRVAAGYGITAAPSRARSGTR